jgi:hypothetical protein
MAKIQGVTVNKMHGVKAIEAASNVDADISKVESFMVKTNRLIREHKNAETCAEDK